MAVPSRRQCGRGVTALAPSRCPPPSRKGTTLLTRGARVRPLGCGAGLGARRLLPAWPLQGLLGSEPGPTQPLPHPLPSLWEMRTQDELRLVGLLGGLEGAGASPRACLCPGCQRRPHHGPQRPPGLQGLPGASA